MAKLSGPRVSHGLDTSFWTPRVEQSNFRLTTPHHEDSPLFPPLEVSCTPPCRCQEGSDGFVQCTDRLEGYETGSTATQMYHTSSHCMRVVHDFYSTRSPSHAHACAHLVTQTHAHTQTQAQNVFTHRHTQTCTNLHVRTTHAHTCRERKRETVCVCVRDR